ncbi:MAG: GNAT family N-acetyltransferase [Dactylosporangium sp.]|nr:GNAT family N-acetyltransferase [Dactylosporangium sp.]NNJ62544.1 GNAT family N-acetyltransferase [Dactylosporangium sp.]
MYPVNLVGKRVVLREFREGDGDDLYAINGDERVTTWLSFDRRTREQTRTALAGILERAQHEARTEYYLALSRPAVDRVIGGVRLGLAGVNAAKLGYSVHADHWGQGYATDAVRAMVVFGFRTLGLHRISAAIGPDNAPSVAVVKRLGFQYEGRLRDHVYTNGAWRDSLLYSLLDHECPAVTEAG